MATLEQRIVKYRKIELAVNTILHGSGKLNENQKREYRRIFHEARIKRMKLQLEMIDSNDISPIAFDFDKDTDIPDDAKKALEEATEALVS